MSETERERLKERRFRLEAKRIAKSKEIERDPEY